MKKVVVICFQTYIFVILNTAYENWLRVTNRL